MKANVKETAYFLLRICFEFNKNYLPIMVYSILINLLFIIDIHFVELEHILFYQQNASNHPICMNTYQYFLF